MNGSLGCRVCNVHVEVEFVGHISVSDTAIRRAKIPEFVAKLMMPCEGLKQNNQHSTLEI